MANPLLDGRQFKAWEMDPSTRESLRLFTKRIPIDVTLATADTAESIFTVSPGLATVNLVTNPSCETSDPPTGYTAVRSGVLAQDGTYYDKGAYSLKITPPNTLRGEGAYWDLGAFSKDDPLAISAYFRRGAAGSPTVRVELVAATVTSEYVGAITTPRIQVGNTVTCGATWQRSQLVSAVNRKMTVFHISSPSGTLIEDETLTGATSGSTAVARTLQQTNNPMYIVVDTQSAPFTPQVSSGSSGASEVIEGGTSGETATLTKVEDIILTNPTLYLYMVTAAASATVFYVDDVQAEIQEQVTTYCDGAQGYLHWWDGVAHQSTSRRWRGMSSIRGMRLHATRDCYVNYDADASNDSTLNAEDRGELIKAGTDFWETSPIYLDSHISFINRLSGEQPTLYGRIDGC